MKKAFFTSLLVLMVAVAFGKTAIDTSAILDIGGIKQFVSIKGADRSKPILLFITGGPGQTSIGTSIGYTGELIKHFMLVEWDQRECGETLRLNKSPVPITLTCCEQDAREMVEVLLHHFHQQKLFVMGWSWGTALGFYLAYNCPEKLYAYLAISPVVNQLESERIALKEMKTKAQNTHNKQAVKELAKMTIPFGDASQVFYDRKWMFTFDGQQIDEKNLKGFLLAPQNKWVMTLFDEASTHNLIKEYPAFKCPVYFFVGKNDIQTNHLISMDYFKQLKAPKKQLFLFEKSGHTIPFSEPALLQRDIDGKVLGNLGMNN
jgi:pimeloyl-ACP methyl ester carboxylesterase